MDVAMVQSISRPCLYACLLAPLADTISCAILDGIALCIPVKTNSENNNLGPRAISGPVQGRHTWPGHELDSCDNSDHLVHGKTAATHVKDQFRCLHESTHAHALGQDLHDGCAGVCVFLLQACYLHLRSISLRRCQTSILAGAAALARHPGQA